jgi:hypothetical protein
MTREEKNSFSNIILERAEMLKINLFAVSYHSIKMISLELEVAAGLVNEVLRYRLQEDAQDLRYMPRSNNRLPI